MNENKINFKEKTGRPQFEKVKKNSSGNKNDRG